MKRPAIFFDRDNTLIASDGYLGDPNGVVLVDGAADAVARARALGYATVVVSNQSGVARGMFGEDAVHAVNSRLDELLQDENPAAIIDRHEFCPYHPDATVERYKLDSDLRKPKPGMILLAAEKLALDLSRSWVIGDAPRDVVAGRAAGCRTILFTDPKLPASPAAHDALDAEPDFIANTLGAALGYIEQHHLPADEEEPAEAPAVIAIRGREEDEEPAEVERSATDETIAVRTEAAPDEPTNPPSPALPPDDERAPTPSPASSAAPLRETEPPRPVSEPEPQPVVSAVPPPQAVPPSPASATPVRPVDEAPAPLAPPPPANVDLSRLESLVGQLLDEMRRRHEQTHTEFSVSKLFAGIVQVLVFAVLFMGYLAWQRNEPVTVLNTLVFALVLQTLTISLLIMTKQK